MVLSRVKSPSRTPTLTDPILGARQMEEFHKNRPAIKFKYKTLKHELQENIALII